MAFPAKIFVNDLEIPTPSAFQLQALRQAEIARLFIQPAVETEPITKQLAQIVQVLSRSATNEPTAYEEGLVKTSATSSANLLTRQVERAISQVLGRSPGKGSTGFMQALHGTFPTGYNGKVSFTPARSAVSLYSPYGNENQVLADANGASLTGQIPIEQANLYRQASIIAMDALKVLAAITPFDPTADVDAVEALKALIRSQIDSLVTEFGRLDEPRGDLVNLYLNTLEANIRDLGIRGRLIDEDGFRSSSRSSSNIAKVFPVTLDDEAQVAAIELLKNYRDTLEDIFDRFLAESTSEQISGHYSERLARVSILLPVVADSNTSLMAALDSIGFTESERRSDAALFTSLATGLSSTFFELLIDDNSVLDPDRPNGSVSTLDIDRVSLPNITLNDFNDWIDRFATLEAPTILADSGRFGLDFVTDQADTLFWVIAIVLDFIQSDKNSMADPFIDPETLLERIISFDRVQQTLRELAFQLDTLADFGVDASTNNLLVDVNGGITITPQVVQ